MITGFGHYHKFQEGDTLHVIGLVYSRLGDLKKSLESYKKALKISIEIEDKSGEGTTLSSMGLIYLEKGDSEKVLENYKKALKISIEIGDKEKEGDVLNNIGHFYHQTEGNLEKGLEFVEKALKIYQKIEDKSGICYSLFNMGVIFWQKDDKENAMESWIKVYNIVKEVGLVEFFDKLEKLAEDVGIPYGFEGWGMLARKELIWNIKKK